MSEFYTSVSRYGNQILYVGYKDGQRVHWRDKFSPTFYLEVEERLAEARTLDGKSVASFNPGTMKECKEFIEVQETSGVTVYGNTDYVAQYIAQKFPNGCDFDTAIIDVSFLDIEVKSDQGFPDPAQALFPITAITITSSLDDTYYSWGLGDFDPEKFDFPHRVKYVKCKDEHELLHLFMDHWSTHVPDVVTGWNSKFFDMTYIVNRVARLLTEEETKRFSLFRIQPNRQNDKFSGEWFDIAGVSYLDYLDLFKKFAVPAGWGNQESYKLDHIADVVLGQRKVDYTDYATLANLYSKNHQLFMEYNVIDTNLVVAIDDKLGLISLAMTLAYKAGTNYEVTFGSVKIWDTYIYNVLRRSGVALTPGKKNSSHGIEGAYVKEPQKGMHEWVCSFDLNSLYPHLIMQYNMSPETITYEVLSGVTVDDMLNKAEYEVQPNACLTPTGQMFRTDVVGFFPKIVEELYDERSKKKRLMLEIEQKIADKNYSSDQEKYQLEKLQNRYNNEQHAVKILMNSLYGAMSNQYFRYYDWRMAEAITISGQLSIRWAERTINEYLNELLKTDKDYVIAIDTDSLYVVLDDLVKKINPSNPVDFIARAAEKFESIIGSSYEELKNYTGAKNQKMVMKREIIADKAIFTGKKRYIANVWDKEGVRYSEAKIKITGIESVRSSTPKYCRTLINDTMRVIMNGSEKEVQDFIASAKAGFFTLKPEEVAFPRGVTSISDYERGSGGYDKGTPIHVRAAILYNRLLREHHLENVYPTVKDGDKIKFVYLRMPNKLKENVIGWPILLPKEFGLHDAVDYETQFSKSYVEPIKHILDAIGWSVEKQNTLESFFS